MTLSRSAPADPASPVLGAPPADASLPPPWILYVDLDAYYVAAEQRDRPELLGRPVIVGPPPSDGPSRGVVLSASYEARAFGVKSAMPVAQAARLCPEAVWVPPHFEKYERLAHEVRERLRPHARRLIPFSIDECLLVVDAPDGAAARELAVRLQRELREGLRLSASIGVATSRTVGKIASDRAKPGGVLLVPPEQVVGFLAPLPVRAIPGVGPRTEEALGKLGIRTIGELAAHRAADLVRVLGGFGRELIEVARGNFHESYEERGGPRSRSAERTLPEDASHLDPIVEVVRHLAGELAHELESEGLRYGAVVVALRWGDFERSQRGRSLPAAREGSETLVEVAERLVRSLWADDRLRRGRGVRTVSVRVERLSERNQRQVSLDEFKPPGARGAG